jgi:type II secretory pathway component PulF
MLQQLYQAEKKAFLEHAVISKAGQTVLFLLVSLCMWVLKIAQKKKIYRDRHRYNFGLPSFVQLIEKLSSLRVCRQE